MNNKLLLLAALLLCFPILTKLNAKQITVDQAMKVAQNIYQSEKRLRSVPDLKLVYTKQSETKSLRNSQASNNLYYVFDMPENGGFIIIAADDKVYPIIAYADEGNYIQENQPENIKWWLKGVAAGIEKSINEDIIPDIKVSEQWETLSSGNILHSRNTDEEVKPLLSTKWSQREPFNKMTPEFEGERTLTGCIATAMAQIMNYYKYPVRGVKPIEGYTTRVHKIVVPARDITQYQYGWKNMNNVYYTHHSEEQTDAVSLLMFDCGASVKMDFRKSFSGAYSSDIVPALRDNFGYDESIAYIKRNQVKDEQEWVELLKSNLQNKQPVYYAGSSFFSGHAFVCDGYKTFNGQTLFHLNLGWGGMDDAYYSVNIPNDYSFSQEIIVNIKPAQETVGTSNLVVSQDIQTDALTTYLTVGQNINISGELMTVVDDNTYNGKFEGQYKFIITDAAGTIFMETAPQNISFTGREQISSSYTLSQAGIFQLKVAYKTSGESSWKIASRGIAEILDLVDLNVFGPVAPTDTLLVSYKPELKYDSNSMEKKFAPGEIVEFVSRITTPYVNYKNTTFKGKYALALIDQDNNVKHIYERENVFTGELRLSFDIAIPVDAAPGKYAIKIVSKSADENEWRVLSGYNSRIVNNIDITVGDPAEVELCLMGSNIRLSEIKLGQGQRIFVDANLYTNIQYGIFSGKYCIQVMDLDGKLHHSTEEKEVNVFNGCLIEEYITFPDTIPEGKYKVGIYTKKGEGNWQLVNFYDGRDGTRDVEVMVCKEVSLNESIVISDNPDILVPGKYFYVRTKLKGNPEKVKYTMDYQVILVDKLTQEEYLARTGEFTGGSSAVNSFSTYIMLPYKVTGGYYSLIIKYRLNNKEEYRTLTGETEDIVDKLEVVLQGARVNEHGVMQFFGRDFTTYMLSILDLSQVTSIDMSTINIPSGAIKLDQKRNPNSIIYVDKAATYPANWTNVAVVNDDGTCEAETIELVDNKPFYSIKDIFAKNVVYKRYCWTDGGWESICIPFEVEKIEDMQGNAVNYELQSLSSNKENIVNFKDVPDKRILVDQPYIISFDRKETAFRNYYKLIGSHIPASGEVKKETSDYAFKGTYKEISGKGKYVLGEGGKTFGVGTEDSKITPFHAYIESLNSTDGLPLRIGNEDDPTGIGQIAEDDLTINTLNGCIEIISGKVQDIQVYSIDGRLISIYSLNKGYNRINNLPKGVYLINSRKAIVK